MSDHVSQRQSGPPLRLGFYLLEKNCFLYAWPNIWYRGVNRSPSDPFADQILAHEKPPASEAGAVWDEWWDVHDSGTLNSNLTIARGLLEKFRRVGVFLELVYIEVVHFPRDLNKYQVGSLWSRQLDVALQYHRAKLPPDIERPRSAQFLGYDLSTLHANFHSAILQPGLDRLLPDLPRKLNENGLIANLGVAVEVLEIANSMEYGPLPFCVMGVWEV